MKACPYCAEQIQDAAIYCRYCARDLPGVAAATAISRQQAPEPFEPAAAPVESERSLAPQPAHARSRRGAAVVVSALLTGSIAIGIYLLSSSAGSSASAAGANGTPLTRGTCTVASSSNDANAIVRGYGATIFCARQARTWSESGFGGVSFWFVRQGDNPVAAQYGATALGTVCRATTVNGGLTIQVVDAGGQSIGQSMCGAIAASRDWTVQST